MQEMKTTTKKPGTVPRERWGKAIRATRIKQGMSLMTLASTVGVTKPTLSRWERGLYPIGDDQKVAVAKALGTTCAELFAWTK
jgi:transcriptional regulator with XRE-family HTH domain